MAVIKDILVLTRDILKGANSTVWGGAEGVAKASKIVKTGLSGADVVIGVSHTLEDVSCSDYVCAGISAAASVSSTLGLILGNIDSTKSLTVVTGSITVGCRTVRYYCKNYGTFWGCTVAAREGVKEVLKFTFKP